MRREVPKTFFREFGLSLFVKLPTLFWWNVCEACGMEFRHCWWWEIGYQNPIQVCGHCCKTEEQVVAWWKHYMDAVKANPPRGGSGTAPVDPKLTYDPFRPVG